MRIGSIDIEPIARRALLESGLSEESVLSVMGAMSMHLLDMCRLTEDELFQLAHHVIPHVAICSPPDGWPSIAAH